MSANLSVSVVYLKDSFIRYFCYIRDKTFKNLLTLSTFLGAIIFDCSKVNHD